MEWIQRKNYILAELDERTAHRAATIGAEHQLKGADASILATADSWGCKRLYTRDGDLLKCDGLLGFKITHPEEPPEPELELFNLAKP